MLNFSNFCGKYIIILNFINYKCICFVFVCNLLYIYIYHILFYLFNVKFLIFYFL